MMKRLNVERFRNALIDAIQHSVAESRRLSSADGPYGFSIAVDRLGAAVAAIAQNENGLARFVAKEIEAGIWTSTKGDVKELVAKMERWGYGDWPSFEPFYAEVNRILDESYESDPAEFIKGGTRRFVHMSCLETLANLDMRGAFGQGNQRSAIVLNIYMGDQSDLELLSLAERINPYEVYAKYAAELQEAHEAFKQLVYTGPV